MNAAEKALYPLGAIATGIAGAGVVKEGMSRPSLSEKIKQEARDDSDKAEELRRKKEPSGGDNKATGSAKAMKKGGAVKAKKVAGKLAKRGYGISR